MTVLAQALADFGRDIGLDGLVERPEGGLQLRLDNGDVLGIQVHESTAVVHYAQPCAYDAPARLLKAMKLSQAVGSDSAMVQVGLRETAQERWLVVAQRMSALEVSARHIHQMVAVLRDFVQQARI